MIDWTEQVEGAALLASSTATLFENPDPLMPIKYLIKWKQETATSFNPRLLAASTRMPLCE